MLNILAQSMKGDAFQLGAGVVQSVIGFLIVIAGIGILIGILYLASFVITKVTKPKAKKAIAPSVKKEAPAPSKKKVEPVLTEPVSEEKIPDEVKAAIVAAIMAFYTAENPKAEFTVKRIKRI